jgi:DNA-directed RNA polymerase specialized sigma24 family protein
LTVSGQQTHEKVVLQIPYLDLAIVSRVSEALEKLALVDPQCAELIKLRFFVGLNYQAAAQALGISERSAQRQWTFGRSWLFRELSRQQPN